jgi:hypothetical protein
MKTKIEKLIEICEKYFRYEKGNEQISPTGRKYRWDRYIWDYYKTCPYWMQKAFNEAKKEVEPNDNDHRAINYTQGELIHSFYMGFSKFKGQAAKKATYRKLIILS